MHKITLKKLLYIKLNDNKSYGNITKLAIWSPSHHHWMYLNDGYWNSLPKKDKKFLLKQPIASMGVRDDMKDTIAVFLKEF